MLGSPIKQGEFVLGETRQNAGVSVLPDLLFHIGPNSRDAGIVLMFVVGYEQIKFTVLFDLHAKIIQRLDRRVAGENPAASGRKKLPSGA